MKSIYSALALVLAAVALTACGSSTTSVSPVVAVTPSTTGTTTTGTLAFALSTTSLTEGQSIGLSATGGVAPYEFCISTNYGCQFQVADMGSVNTLTGFYTAPSIPTSVTLEVFDSVGDNASVTVTIAAGSTLTNDTPVVISPAAGSYVEGQNITLTVTGGTPSYNFAVTNGAGGTFSNQSANQIIFTAPTTPGNVTVQVTDASSLVATATFTILTPNGLMLTPGNGSVGTGQTIQFQALGGTGPFTFSAASGFGSFPSTTGNNTNVYDAPVVPGTATITVLDHGTGKSATTQLTVAATYSTTQINPPQSQIIVDQYAAISYDNTTPGAVPYFLVFGTGPNRDAASAGMNSGYFCDQDANGNLMAPCAITLSLTNFNTTTNALVTYRGAITVTGRSATATMSYCIPPSNTQIAYSSQSYYYVTSGSPSYTWSQIAFNGATNELFGGALTETYFVDVDSEPSSGAANVSYTGGYTANANCSDFPSTFVQVY